MGLSILGFNFGGTHTTDSLPDIFPFPWTQKEFVHRDMINFYSRILTEVFERTLGLDEDYKPYLFDNCLASESAYGLITYLAWSMTDKTRLYLVFEKDLKLLRKAKPEEQEQITQDYAKSGESKVGIYVTFEKYIRTDMLKIYSAMEYSTVASLSKGMNVSKALQLKMTDLRASVGMADSGGAVTQARAIADSLKEGKDVLMDAKDIISLATMDMGPTDAAEAFINKKLSKYSGMPASWITGEIKNSMGDTGEGAAREVERGLGTYFFSIAKPVLDKLFDVDVEFESEDYTQLTTATETLKTFDITSNDFLSQENKQQIVNRLFGLEEENVGDTPKDVVPPVIVPPVAVPPAKAKY